MKKIHFFMALLSVAAISAFKISVESLPIGSDIPKADVKMQDISGKEISLKDAMGKKGLLVMFSCNTCPYVIKNQQRTIDACSYAKSKGLGVIILNSNEAYRDEDDSYEAMQKYAADQQYKWFYTVDKNHQIADAFGATRTPETFLFNDKGKLVYHGAIDDNPSDASDIKRAHLKLAIDELLDGKEISVKESRSVGCTIKRLP